MPSKDPERRREVNREFYRFRRGLSVDAALDAAKLLLGHKTPCIAYYRVYREAPPHLDYERASQRMTVERLVGRAGAILIGAYEQPEKRGSGQTNKRLQLGAALTNCQVQGAMLIIAKLGHLVDSARFLSQLAASGVSFVACDKPHVNHRTVEALALAARRKEKARTERRRAAWSALKARGYRPVNATPEAARRGIEAAQMQSRLFAAGVAPYLEAARRNGCRTLAEFAAALNGIGLTTRRGHRWDTSAVHRALQRARDLTPSTTLQIAAAAKLIEAADTSQPIFRTGAPGRSSGFGVIEAEARRRYADGEHHQNAMGVESPKGWAGVLLPWYKSQYPGWPKIGQRTLRNRLIPVLRDLEGRGGPQFS